MLDTISLSTFSSLRNIKPVYGASFVLKTVNNETVPLLRLDVEYQADANDHIDCVSKKWSRIETETEEITKLLDISLVDLNKSVY